MAMIEQNISGVKLERMRKKAYRKTVVLAVLPRVIFVIGIILTLIYNRYTFIMIIEGDFKGAGVILGSLGMLLGGVMLSFGAAAMGYAIYMCFFWKKPYDLFNANYKNKYVLLRIREIPGFSGLKYFANRGLSYRELSEANLLPGRTEAFFRSKDYFEGAYNQIRFRSCSVETFDTKSSLALFKGQVMVFSMFHEFKISETPVQVFSKKENDKMKGLAFPVRIESENELFNRMFSVYAADGHNAFYILTPDVMEDIMEFAEMLPNSIYLVFAGQSMYVGCEQMRNPFDAVVDSPLEEQSRNIVIAADLIRKAGDILIHIENVAGRRQGQ